MTASPGNITDLEGMWRRLMRDIMQAVDEKLRLNSGGAVGGSGSGGSGTGTTEFNLTSGGSIALGSQAQSGSFTWYTVSGAGLGKRNLVWRFYVESTASNLWSLEVWSKPGGTGEMLLQAIGIGHLFYHLSWPWLHENGNGAQELYLGIRNLAASTSTFSISDFRGEKLG